MIQSISFSTPFLQGVDNSIVSREWLRFFNSILTATNNNSQTLNISFTGGLSYTSGIVSPIYGASAFTICEGNDPRLNLTFSNGLTESGYNIQPNYGTAANTVCQGNDPRLYLSGAYPGGVQVITSNTNLSEDNLFVKITASSTVTTQLISPNGNAGAGYLVWNNTGNNQTISTAANNIVTFAGSSASTYTLAANSGVRLTSDGSNWILG